MKAGKKDESINPQNQGPSEFQTTHWSLVIAAGKQQSPEKSRALSKLCQSYWVPLYSYARKRVSDVHSAQDATQAFFETLLDKNYVADADPNRGRFRSFLITAFKHFLSKERDRARALKRGGRRPTLSLDFNSADSQLQLPDSVTAEQIFERQWAVTLLERVIQRLEREQERQGKGRQFQILKRTIVGESNRPNYAELAKELEMAVPATRMASSRLRNRYRDLLRDEIAQTVVSQEDIDDEIRHLFAIFAT